MSFLQLGNVNFSTSSSALQKLKELENKIDHTKKLAKSYNVKFQELARFNKQLTEGYIKNVNVIVDIGSLLNVYNSVFATLMNVIKEFDTELSKDIDPAQIAHIQALTERSLGRVSDFFHKDVNNVKNLMEMMGEKEMIVNLNSAAAHFEATQSKVPEVLTALRNPSVGGRRHLRVSKKTGGLRSSK
jgi:hypothetical protein